MKRVILVVLDSLGIGSSPDAEDYGDEGAFTLKSASTSEKFYMPNLAALGLFDIEGVRDALSACGKTARDSELNNVGSIYARLREASAGKDTTTGHWEMAGIISEHPFPTFPEGFPKELTDKLEEAFGSKILCNRPYSGTEVIKDYGKEHIQTGCPIVYTSADSVLQIAAHDSVISLERLYEFCKIARKLCVGKYGVGRVIARPFTGDWPYTRTRDRHDFSLEPERSVLDIIKDAGLEVFGVGKIYDIFAGKGLTDFVRTVDNADGIEKTIIEAGKRYGGLTFVNLVDTDMIYGHRRDIDGYASALSAFDAKVPEIINAMSNEDLLIVTADHGCDPGFKGTDHTREYVPMVCAGKSLKGRKDMGTRDSFADIAVSMCDYLGISKEHIKGVSFL